MILRRPARNMAGKVMARPICTTDRDHPVQSDSPVQIKCCCLFHGNKKNGKKSRIPPDFQSPGGSTLPSGSWDLEFTLEEKRRWKRRRVDDDQVQTAQSKQMIPHSVAPGKRCCDILGWRDVTTRCPRGRGTMHTRRLSHWGTFLDMA